MRIMDVVRRFPHSDRSVTGVGRPRLARSPRFGGARSPGDIDSTMIFSFVRSGESEFDEVRAFPTNMVEHVKSSVRPLARGQMHSPSKTVLSVQFAGELLSIPYRVYYDERRLVKAMDRPDETALVALCLGTRHYDGFIRERCLRRLLAFDENWTAPFVVPLLGEYVIEVIQPIHERFIDGVETKYIEFFTHNIKYCQYLEQRATSYWNQYYRSQFLKRTDYPAVKALVALKAAASIVDDAT